MPAGFYIDGQITYRPVVSVVSEFAAQAGLGPATKTLAVIGEFPFLEAGVPYFYTSETALLAASPNNSTVSDLARLIFRPSTVAPFNASPGLVVLMNVTPNTAAAGAILDPLGAETLRVTSSVWGPAGNLITTTVTPRVGFSGYDVKVTSNGLSDTFVVEEFSNVLTMAYAHPNNGDAMVAPKTARGFDDTIDGTGTLTAGKASGAANISITFSRTLTQDSAGADDTHTSWIPDGPVEGLLTVSVPGGDALAAGTELLVDFWGYNSAGVAATDTVTFTAAEVAGGVAVSKTTLVNWSSVTKVSVYSDAGAGDWTGDLTIAGTSMLVGPARGQDTVAQAIGFLNGLKGFSADTEAFSPTKIPVAQLDPVMADVFPAEFDANRWAFYDSFNANTTLASVEYVGDYALAPDFSSEVSFSLAGGTQGSVAGSDWVDALKALRVVPITALVPYSTSTDVILACKDHVVFMWGKGQSECQLVAAAPSGSTLSALRTLRRQLNDFRCTLLCDAVRVRRSDGSTSGYSDVFWGVMFGALQCATTIIGQPLGGARPDIVGFTRHADLAGVEGAEELLRNCITPLLDDGNGIHVVRWVTTHSEDNDFTRTEGSAVESLAVSNIGVRNAVRKYLNQRAVGGVAAAIKADIAAELEQQQKSETIRTWTPQSLVVEETTASFNGRYEVGPILPVLNIAITSVAFSFPRA